jgi:hypothetical protein
MDSTTLTNPDYRTLTQVFSLLFVGSFIGPLWVMLLAVVALTIKNHELLLSVSPTAQEYVTQLKTLVKPYLRQVLAYVQSTRPAKVSIDLKTE